MPPASDDVLQRAVAEFREASGKAAAARGTANETRANNELVQRLLDLLNAQQSGDVAPSYPGGAEPDAVASAEAIARLTTEIDNLTKQNARLRQTIDQLKAGQEADAATRAAELAKVVRDNDAAIASLTQQVAAQRAQLAELERGMQLTYALPKADKIRKLLGAKLVSDFSVGDAVVYLETGKVGIVTAKNVPGRVRGMFGSPVTYTVQALGETIADIPAASLLRRDQADEVMQLLRAEEQQQQQAKPEADAPAPVPKPAAPVPAPAAPDEAAGGELIDDLPWDNSAQAVRDVQLALASGNAPAMQKVAEKLADAMFESIETADTKAFATATEDYVVAAVSAIEQPRAEREANKVRLLTDTIAFVFAKAVTGLEFMEKGDAPSKGRFAKNVNPDRQASSDKQRYMTKSSLSPNNAGRATDTEKFAPPLNMGKAVFTLNEDAIVGFANAFSRLTDGNTDFGGIGIESWYPANFAPGQITSTTVPRNRQPVVTSDLVPASTKLRMALWAASQLQTLRRAAGDDDAELISAVRFLFFTRFPWQGEPGEADATGETTLLRLLGRRPSYQLAFPSGDTVTKYVVSKTVADNAVAAYPTASKDMLALRKSEAAAAACSLVHAVHSGHVDAVRVALDEAARRDGGDDDVYEGLMAAARAGSLAVLPAFAAPHVRAQLLGADWIDAANAAANEQTRALITGMHAGQRFATAGDDDDDDDNDYAADAGASGDEFAESTGLFDRFASMFSSLDKKLGELQNKGYGKFVNNLRGSDEFRQWKGVPDKEKPYLTIVAVPDSVYIENTAMPVGAFVLKENVKQNSLKGKQAANLLGGTTAFYAEYSPSTRAMTGIRATATSAGAQQDIVLPPTVDTFGEFARARILRVSGTLANGESAAAAAAAVEAAPGADAAAAAPTAVEPDVTSLASGLAADLAAAANDDEAYGIVNDMHEWLNRLQVRDNLPAMDLVPAEAWYAAVGQLRTALTSRGYNTVDSEAWQHVQALENRYAAGL